MGWQTWRAYPGTTNDVPVILNKPHIKSLQVSGKIYISSWVAGWIGRYWRLEVFGGDTSFGFGNKERYKKRYKRTADCQ